MEYGDRTRRLNIFLALIAILFAVFVPYASATCTSSQGEVEIGESAFGYCCTESGWEQGECVLPAVCGNGMLEDAEECEDFDYDNHDTCKSDCTINFCGDGIVKSEDEDCDLGSANGQCPSPCSGFCTINRQCSGDIILEEKGDDNEENKIDCGI